MPSKLDKFAALRDARAKGGRLSQWKPEDAELYDEVTDDQYRSIVGSRLERDDFIIDDDGSGYADQGMDDWEGADEEEESEDEDDFEGEDEELRRARKLKRAKAKARANGGKKVAATKSKPKASFSDYARPAASTSTSTYRPAPSAIQEDDFMDALMSSVTATSTSAALDRKRKSSPDISSSEGMEPSSEGSFFSNKKRYGMESDEEDLWGTEDAKSRRAATGKKPRTSEMTVVPDENDVGMDVGMGMDMEEPEPEPEPVVKAEPMSEDEDMEIKPRVGPLHSAANKLNGAITGRRKVVNSSSVKHVVPKPEPISIKTEPEISSPAAKPKFLVNGKPAPAGSAHWSAVQESLVAPKTNELDEVKAQIGSVKAENVLEEDGSLRIFWLDHMEQDGVIHLVGKVVDRASGKFVSACLSVQGIKRNLFVKPRARRFQSGHETDIEVTKTDVFQDFDSYRRKAGIEEWRSKFVKRKYAFEDKTVEKGESEWLKVVYGFDGGFSSSSPEPLRADRSHPSEPELPLDASGPTFSHVFGTNTTPFELLVIKRKIMGRVGSTSRAWPSARPRTRTWEGCNIEDPSPPDRLPSSLNTIVRPIEKFPPGFEARGKNDRSPFQTVKAERAMLNSLLATIQRQDPDVIVGHNFLGNTFEALLYRMKELKADHWSRIGRFRRKQFNISKAGSNVRLLSGRLVADLSSDAAKGMISSTTWSLTEMCGTHLKIQREDVDPEDTHSYFDHTLSSPDRLVKFIRLCEIDAYFQMAIASRVQMLPLTKQLTNLAGNSWNLTLNGGRAVRNEFILLHEFHRLKYVCPDKDGDEEAPPTKSRGKAKYAGGLVFEPKRGLWDTYILVMDFNSLYPSIIQEYNIDFTTVDREQDDDAEEEKIPEVPEADVAQGVLPRIIATLVGRRRQYDIKQQALKLTANSMYGCLGFQGSRFSSRPLAALTTFKGREILTHTRELAESLQLDVVYGDTDSVFVNSNVTTYPEALKIANDFKKLVNERYKLLEIDLDAVFERILLLNKKKYAAVKIDESGEKATEVKGLDMKRREFSKISKDSSSAVLKEILSGEATEVVISRIHELLTALGESVRNGNVPLDDFIVFKRLGKNPEDYPDKKSQPHVQVALRMKSKGVAVRAHDVIPYILCLGEDGKSAKSAQADRAFHPDDLRRQGSELKIDYDFYLDTQILQPILRLCESIEGTDRARLAECLGLDPSRYSSSHTGEAAERQFFTFESQISDKERFKEADPLSVRCMACESSFAFEGLLEDSSNTIQPIGVVCPACTSVVPAPSIAVQLENAIRSHISRYYLGWTVCDGDDGCGARTRMMGVYGRRCLGMEREGCKGTVRLEICDAFDAEVLIWVQYPDLKLYNQLLYYHHLFDAEKALVETRGSGRHEEIRALAKANQTSFSLVTAVADRYLDRNGRRYVDMRGLFGFMERIQL
ncbi:DNA-directed DNA polymerase alpha catalytic subunit pol1 [Saitozyma podzolica]|uniref:DNA polymerase n=1 Tax=Saitozyma podzolica TaxID=1890683 RepID=A0A427YG84_9TREE|nr:DNA-directed DNA polymerase alpha catalytic subunit pol1 [Saitozyma podzolica]